ncbi:hypothetical protein D3C81_1783900 [compost metagenome]
MPMPVSSTLRLTNKRSSAIGLPPMMIFTSPLSVNLMALPTRFESTCLTRIGSTSTSQLTIASICRLRVSAFCRANPSNTRATDSTTSRRFARRGLRLAWPDSIRTTSRMSPISSSSPRAES